MEEMKRFAKYFDENPKSLVSPYVNVKEERKLTFIKELKKLYTNQTLVEDTNAMVRVSLLLKIFWMF